MDETHERPRGLHAGLLVGGRTLRSAQDDRVIGLGAEVAFFTLLSLPPALLAIFGGVGYVADALGPNLTGRIREQIILVAGTFLTSDALNQWLIPTLDDLLSEGRPGIVSIGVLVAIWSASRAVKVLREAVSVAYNETDTRSPIVQRLIAVGMTLVGLVGIVIVMPLLVSGPRIVEAVTAPLGLDAAAVTVWKVLYWPLVGLLGIGLLTTFFHYAPPRGTPWRRDLPGAVLAALLWTAGAGALRLYTLWSIEAGGTYGPLATPIVILLWLYLTGLAILLGAELNAEIDRTWPVDRARTAPPADGHGTPVAGSTPGAAAVPEADAR